MPVADLHPREAQRLATLRSYEILDTDREVEFDEIVKLAAAVCDLPISVINFIDGDRQWFKAEIGLGVRETPIATSLCAHAILEDDFVEIPDTALDSRTADNPLCTTEPRLRFYAGAILKDANGLPLGTLCVLGHEVRQLTALQRDVLRVLASQVMARLQLRKSLTEADILRREADHRVKNSMQSLLSYIRVAGRTTKEPETTEALRLVSSRVSSVLSIHEMLYEGDTPSAVDLAQYLSEIGTLLSAFAPSGVTLSVDVPSIFVKPRQAVSIGTLVNELVSNSFKHAFPDQMHGQVTISAALTAGGERMRILCEDDGIGAPDAASGTTEGLGTRVIAVLAAELRAQRDVLEGARGYGVAYEFALDHP